MFVMLPLNKRYETKPFWSCISRCLYEYVTWRPAHETWQHSRWSVLCFAPSSVSAPGGGIRQSRGAGPAPGMLGTRYVRQVVPRGSCTRYVMHCARYVRQVVPRGNCTRYVRGSCTRYVMHQVFKAPVYSSGCSARVLHQVCYAPGMYAPSLFMYQVCYAPSMFVRLYRAGTAPGMCSGPELGMLCTRYVCQSRGAGPAPGMLCTDVYSYALCLRWLAQTVYVATWMDIMLLNTMYIHKHGPGRPVCVTQSEQ